jgi:hypothetical protein
MSESAINPRPQGPAEELIAERNARGELAEVDSLPEGERGVRASFLRELLLTRMLKLDIAPLGILMRGARIFGAFDLSGFGGDVAQAPALVLEHGEFDSPIDLSHSSFQRIVLSHAKLPGLNAAYLRTGGPVMAEFLTVTDSAAIDFSAADIGGDLNLASLRADDEFKALRARIAGARIQGAEPGRQRRADRRAIAARRIRLRTPDDNRTAERRHAGARWRRVAGAAVSRRAALRR